MNSSNSATGAHPPLHDLVVGFHHVALSVDDFDAARDFFVGCLGFLLEGEMDRRTDVAEVVGLPDACIRWAMLALGRSRIELFHYYTPNGSCHGNHQAARGYTHIAFEVLDVDAIHERITRAGWATIAPPTSLRGGLTRVVYLLGPEGCVIEFIEFRTRNISSLRAWDEVGAER